MKPIHLLFLLTLLLAACTPAPLPPAPAADLPADVLDQIAADYPRVDGSTSAHPLQTTIACTILEVDCVWWDGFILDDTRNFLPSESFLAEDQDLANQIFTINHNGTHGSYVNLIAGETDLILTARAPSEDELVEAKRAGVFLDIQPVALDAFVFLVHEDNPVDSIDLDVIRAVYTGEVTDWGDASPSGAAGEAIHTYQRNETSGSQVLMESLVMKGTPMLDSPEMILPSMMAPLNAISDDPQGIGYTVYYYVTYIYPYQRVKVIGVDGVRPNAETIADGSYPLAAEVYVVIRGDTPAASTARYLRDWLLTPDGQAAVAQSGYVSLP